jgi:hypothetical protein
VLDTHGADEGRWPADERDALLQLIATDEEAALHHRNARRLDALLEQAPAAKPIKSGRMSALQANILADFARERGQQNDQEDNNIVPFPAKRSAAGHSKIDQMWMTAAALVACFLFGMYLGGNGLGNWQLDPVQTIASLSNSTSQQSTGIGDLIANSGLEEDLL